MKKLAKLARDERGVTIFLVAISMVALLSATALAIDVGNLLVARTESQRAGEAGALYGAAWLIVDPDDAAGARSRAIQAAGENAVRGEAAVVLPEDVDVILDSAIVRVRVRNTSDRGNAIGTFFANIFGVSEVNVSTVSAAWAAEAGSVEPSGAIEDCLLPVGLLDYYDADGNGFYSDGEPKLGFDEDDHGKLLKLTVSGSSPQGGPPICRTEPSGPTGVWNANPDVDYCNGYEDSWSCWWRENEHEGGGSTDLGQAILGLNCATLDIPQQVWQASAGGEKQSLVQSDDAAGGPGSFRDLIDMDLAEHGNQDLYWCPNGEGGVDDPGAGCPMRSLACNTGCVTESPRLRKAPIISTEGITGSGANNTFTISGVTGVFIEKVACSYNAAQLGGPAGNWNVYIRLMTAAGSGPGGNGEEPPEGQTLLRYLQLIE